MVVSVGATQSRTTVPAMFGRQKPIIQSNVCFVRLTRYLGISRWGPWGRLRHEQVQEDDKESDGHCDKLGLEDL